MSKTQSKNLLLRNSFLLFFVLFIFVYGCDSEQSQEYPGYKVSDAGIAFKNVNLIPMTSEKIIKAQTVIVKGSKIVDIGGVNNLKIPENSIIIDSTGYYLMPGLADMHIHTRHDWQSLAWPVSPLNLYLANGVTTIRDFGPKGNPADHCLHWRNAIKKGYLSGPAIYSCGKILYGPVADPAQKVLAQSAKGFDFVKFYSFLNKIEFNEAIAAAKRHNIYSAGHIPFQVGLDNVLLSGMNEIAHVEELIWEQVDFDRNKGLSGYSWLPYVIGKAYHQFGQYQEYDTARLKKVFAIDISESIEKLRVSNTRVCTTMAVDDVIVQKLHRADAFLQRDENRYFMNGYLETFRQGNEKHQKQFKGGKNFAKFKYRVDKLILSELKKAGVPLLLGTDAGTGGMGIIPGFSIHDELRILTGNGFTPYEAIAAGTVNASRTVQTMTGKDDFGSIKIGKRADLILLKKNPLISVKNIKDPLGVMAAGKWYDKKSLQKIIMQGIPILGEIRHIYSPRAGSRTQIEILVGKGFSKRLPDDITKIVVTGPNGKLPIVKSDFKYFPQIRDFFIEIPGPPDIGTYTFIVYDKDKMGLATDTQSSNINIPLATLKSDNTINNEMILNTTPTLSWEPVKIQIPVYYRVNITDSNKKRIHNHSVKEMLSYNVPEGVLKPGQTYFWNVRVSDSDQWNQEQNRSSTRLMKFTTSNE